MCAQLEWMDFSRDRRAVIRTRRAVVGAYVCVQKVKGARLLATAYLGSSVVRVGHVACPHRRARLLNYSYFSSCSLTGSIHLSILILPFLAVSSIIECVCGPYPKCSSCGCRTHASRFCSAYRPVRIYLDR